MDDQPAVGVLDGLADAQKETQPLFEPQPSAVAPVGQRLALDVFEDEVGVAVVGEAAVEQAGDARVLEPGEDPALEQEALGERAAGERRRQQLERHLLLPGAVRPLGETDHSHAAAAEHGEDPVGSDPPPRQRLDRLVGAEQRRGALRIEPIGPRLGPSHRVEQRQHLVADLLGLRRGEDEGAPLRGRTVDRRAEERRDPLAAAGVSQPRAPGQARRGRGSSRA